MDGNELDRWLTDESRGGRKLYAIHKEVILRENGIMVPYGSLGWGSLLDLMLENAEMELDYDSDDWSWNPVRRRAGNCPGRLRAALKWIGESKWRDV